MKFINLFFILICITVNAQNNFEKGKITTDNGQILNVFIGVYNWQTFPEMLDYKVDLEAPMQSIKSTDISSVFLNSGIKYLKKTVEIDNSSNNLDKLDVTREINSDVKTVFLRQIVDGEAKLYIYSGGEKIIFFYETPTQKLEQLIYKKYLIETNKVSYNKTYLSQLKNNVNCKDNSKKASYTIGSLTKYFLKNNECNGDNTSISYKKEKFKIRLKVLVGANYGNINVDNNFLLSSNTLKFQNQISPKIGLEIEGSIPNNSANYISPFIAITNRNYQTNETIRTVNFDVQYFGIEIHPGARYYLNLKDDKYIFIDFGAVINVKISETLKSELFQTNGDNSFFNSSKASLAFSAGYKVNKLSVSLRYNFPINFEGNFIVDESETNAGPFLTKMQNISLQISYDLF